ncbi:trichodiene oxygenase [Aspergillus udagawae]|uniref:Trichodiene oxygenase n=1 Tax=Aspergillus udagawae TaxID=91492 RepID=A0A8H3NK55_9EURO|nr:trichodiene oxygenase [Aspergillus udagawae]
MAVLAVLVVGLAIYWVIQIIYRLYFHPLSHIPGPKLAAITHGYEFYHNIIRGGLFIWELERLHQLYGPIIRINPREVHIKDPDYYDEIYASSLRKREKDPVLTKQFDLEGSGFSSIDPESHRQRRAPVEKYFSKRAIEKMEGLIHESLDRLVYHFKEAHASHQVVSLDAGFAALTSDVIHKYVYGFNPANVDKEGFNAKVRDGINGLFQQAHLLYFFPVLQTIMKLTPLEFLRKYNPPAFALASQKKELYNRAADALENAHSRSKNSDSGTVIEALAAPTVPAHMRKPERLMNEGFALVIGGTETTARSLALGVWHLYSRKDIRNKLREELKQAMPTTDSRPTWNQLEQLPYLSGVIAESLRLSTGIANRSARVAPTEALVYKGYTIPPGTPVSETNYFVLMDPEIFPDPHAFDPERWMRAAAKGQRLDRYLVNFSKGSRMCVGLNLAYAELFLVIATLVRRFDMELYETPKENIEFARDFGTPYPEKGNLSVRAIVTGVIE